LEEEALVARGVEVSCWAGLHDPAAAFDEEDIAPDAVVLADAFAGADDAEASGLVEPEAGGVFGKDSGLDGPDAGGFD
jgi:hypothetical protein